VAIVVSICLGALNGIFSKIKADQLQRFDGLASGVMNAIGYVAGYFPILYLRWRAGIVTTGMLRFMYVDSGDGRRYVRGAHRFIIAGGLADEAGQICSSVAAPYVSIIASTLLGQTSSVWTVVASSIVLHARYVFQEFLGVAVALLGASIEVVDLRNGGDHKTQFSMALLVLAAAAAPAVSFVFKEKVFRLWRQRKKNETSSSSSERRRRRPQTETKTTPLLRSHQGAESSAPTTDVSQLDVWVVASAAAVWSLAWAPAVSLATSYIKKPSSMSLSRYVVNTFRCFSNQLDYRDFIDDDDDDSDAKRACTAAWQWWLLYMVTNIAYNISVYRVVRLASALTSFVCGKLVGPLTIALSLLPWPVVGAGTVTTVQGASLAVVLTGVAIYRLGTMANRRRFGPDGTDDDACCWPIRRRRSSSSIRKKRLPIDDTFLRDVEDEAVEGEEEGAVEGQGEGEDEGGTSASFERLDTDDDYADEFKVEVDARTTYSCRPP